MATLTSDQTTYIRANTTDDTDIVSDVYLQYLYDNQAGSDVDKTIYYALLKIRAHYRTSVNNTNQRTGDSKSLGSIVENINDEISDWGMRTGEGVHTATIGTINLGIDEEDDRFDIE
jgi:hypothetical protein